MSGTPTLAAAAFACGSNAGYVKAAITLIRSENATLLERVLAGDMPLLAAARQAKQIADLVTAYRAASGANRIEAAKTIGADVLFDEAVVPALGVDKVSTINCDVNIDQADDNCVDQDDLDVTFVSGS
jgi:hypothetical protein